MVLVSEVVVKGRLLPLSGVLTKCCARPRDAAPRACVADFARALSVCC